MNPLRIARRKPAAYGCSYDLYHSFSIHIYYNPCTESKFSNVAHTQQLRITSGTAYPTGCPDSLAYYPIIAIFQSKIQRHINSYYSHTAHLASCVWEVRLSLYQWDNAAFGWIERNGELS